MTLEMLRIDPEEAIDAPNLPVLIGRSDQVDVYVSCRWASRTHCEIDHVDGKLVLRDLGSRHGTIVNGEPVREAILNPGDEIGVGLNRFIIKSAGRRTEQPSVTELDSEAI